MLESYTISGSSKIATNLIRAEKPNGAQSHSERTTSIMRTNQRQVVVHGLTLNLISTNLVLEEHLRTTVPNLTIGRSYLEAMLLNLLQQTHHVIHTIVKLKDRVTVRHMTTNDFISLIVNEVEIVRNLLNSTRRQLTHGGRLNGSEVSSNLFDELLSRPLKSAKVNGAITVNITPSTIDILRRFGDYQGVVSGKNHGLSSSINNLSGIENGVQSRHSLFSFQLQKQLVD